MRGEDHHIPRRQGRRELGLYIGREELGIDGTRDDPWCVEPVVAQGGDEGLGVPVTEGRIVDEAFAFRRPASRLYHVGLEPSLIEKDQPFQLVGHDRLTVSLPDTPFLGHVRAGLFSCVQLFFCVSDQAGATVARLPNDAP